MNIQTMTQEQKDTLLATLLNKQAAEEKAAKFKELGISWSTNGLIAVRMPKVGDKNQAPLYINKANLNHFLSIAEHVVEFAQ